MMTRMYYFVNFFPLTRKAKSFKLAYHFIRFSYPEDILQSLQSESLPMSSLPPSLNPPAPSALPETIAPDLALAIQRLHRLQVIARWCFNGAVTIVLMPPSVWSLRGEFQLWLQHFTWVALRYGLGFNPWATLGMVVPVSLVTATLVWHTRNILRGLPDAEHYRLQQEALKIREQGRRHWLWRWVWKDITEGK